MTVAILVVKMVACSAEELVDAMAASMVDLRDVRWAVWKADR